MGDADVAQNMMPVDQLEELMDDALIEVDDEMSRLFAFMSFLNEKVAHVTSAIASLRKFRRCFAAFNLFVFPAILAIVVSYATFQNIEMSETVEVALDIFIKILMYMSLGIGFPLYLCTLCEAYFMKANMEGIVARSHSSDSRTENGSGIDGSELTLEDVEESFETISEFRRLRPEFRRFTNLRNRSNLQTESERSVQQESSQTSTSARMREMQETNEAIALRQQLEEMDEHFEIQIEYDEMDANSNLEKDNIFYFSNSGTLLEADDLNISFSNIEKKDFHDLELFILNPDQDMVAEIEKSEFTHKTAKNGKQETGKNKLLDAKNIRSPGLRNIVIERVSESDLISKVSLKDYVNTGEINGLIFSSTEDLVAEIEKHGCVCKTAETKKQQTEKAKLLDKANMEKPTLRNIVVERVSEVDLNSKDFSKDNVNSDELKYLIFNCMQDLAPKLENDKYMCETMEDSKLETENINLLNNRNIRTPGLRNIGIGKVGKENLISKASSKDKVNISERKGLILNSTQDQVTKIEKNEDICETVENSKRETENKKIVDNANIEKLGLCNIGIESVGEGDLKSKSFSKDNVNISERKGLILNSTQDLDKKIEKNDDICETVEKSKQELEKTKLLDNANIETPALRNIGIEKNGEGDMKSNTFPKSNVNIGDANNLSHFGL